MPALMFDRRWAADQGGLTRAGPGGKTSQGRHNVVTIWRMEIYPTRQARRSRHCQALQQTARKPRKNSCDDGIVSSSYSLQVRRTFFLAPCADAVIIVVGDYDSLLHETHLLVVSACEQHLRQRRGNPAGVVSLDCSTSAFPGAVTARQGHVNNMFPLQTQSIPPPS